MKFVPSSELLAQAEGYAVPAFNTNGGSYDLARAALEAARETHSPLILQVYEPNCAYRGYGYFVNLAQFLCAELELDTPVALQLDHGHSYDSVMAAIKAGFTSVMFDASHEPLAVNIEQTQAVIAAAHPLGVSVEAEVGYVQGNDAPSPDAIGRLPIPPRPTLPPTKTSVNEAAQFCQAVEVDMLAVSIGTTHGVYETQDNLDFALLKNLREEISVPLVQHGTCGISLENLTKLAQGGMRKVNFGEPFRLDYIRQFCDLADTAAHHWHPWRIMEMIKDRLKQNMIDFIHALGSEGKA